MVLFSNEIIGFFFIICDKFHPVARVYLPYPNYLKLPQNGDTCPLRALRLLWAHDLLGSSPFYKMRLIERDLIEGMKHIDRNNKDFKTQPLRIEAHTFFVTYGLPDDFVEFLARKKSPRLLQIYLRAS